MTANSNLTKAWFQYWFSEFSQLISLTAGDWKAKDIETGSEYIRKTTKNNERITFMRTLYVALLVCFSKHFECIIFSIDFEAITPIVLIPIIISRMNSYINSYYIMKPTFSYPSMKWLFWGDKKMIERCVCVGIFNTNSDYWFKIDNNRKAMLACGNAKTNWGGG